MLKSRVPRIDPRGTPARILSHSLNKFPVLQSWYLFVRWVFTNKRV